MSNFNGSRCCFGRKLKEGNKKKFTQIGTNAIHFEKGNSTWVFLRDEGWFF